MGFNGLYDLIRYPSWPVGIFEYQPDPITPLTFIRPDGRWITLAYPFQTDLASTPRIVWPIYGLAPQDLEQGSLIHDALFMMHHAGNELYGFYETNKVLQEACLASGYSRPMAWAIRKCCDWFGKGIWNNNKPPVIYQKPHGVKPESVSARKPKI